MNITRLLSRPQSWSSIENNLTEAKCWWIEPFKLCRPICSVDLRHRFQNKFVGSISSYETSITILHGYVLVLFHRIHCMEFFNAHLQKICHWQTRSTFTWCFASVVSHNSSNMFSLLLLIELHWSRRLVANNIVVCKWHHSFPSWPSW